MEDHDKSELFERILDAPPRQREALINQFELSNADRAELDSLAKTADDIWLSAQGAPPLEKDRTAALLGLVPNDVAVLDGKKLTGARKKSRLNIEELANRLKNRGWQISTKDVYQWERGNTKSVPPALIEAVSQVITAPIDQLVIDPTETSDQPTPLQRLRSHPEFEKLAQQWAKFKDISISAAEIALSSRVASTVHRGDKPVLEQDIELLKELVALLSGQDTDKE